MSRTWNVLGIRWVGVSVGDFAAAQSFVRDVLGLEVRHEAQDFLVADAENGDRFEVFGPAGAPTRLAIRSVAGDGRLRGR